MSRRPRASGYFRTSYAQDLALIETRTERTALAVLLIALTALPFLASPFLLDLAAQVLLAVGLIFYVMPWLGLSLLDLCRDVAAFDVPMQVWQSIRSIL